MQTQNSILSDLISRAHAPQRDSLRSPASLFDKDKIRLQGFAHYTTRVFDAMVLPSAMPGPLTHPDTKARCTGGDETPLKGT